jgi:dTDP-4-amino-4,6-dideoxygalactose transaminase
MRCISAKTKAVLLVHLYGQMRDMDAWQDLCAKNDIALIEDCAQAHLSSWQSGFAGSFGQAGAFSFYPTKNLGAPGDAGMLVTQSESMAQRARQLRNYGQSDRYHHPEEGLNSRLDEIQAAMLAERLKWLPEFTERRRQIANAYRAGIQNPLIALLDEPQEPSAHTYHLFVVTCKNRDALASHLSSHDVQTLVHYPVPVHAQKPCRKIARDPRNLQHCDRFAETCLSLPCHPQMTDDDISAVMDAVNAFRGA